MTELSPPRTKRPRKRFLSTRLGMVGVGIMIGLLARYTLGSPDADRKLERGFSSPVSETTPSYEVPLPVAPSDEPGNDSDNDSGLVPPIKIPGIVALPGDDAKFLTSATLSEKFTHDPTAAFHAHGDEVCASGCAVSNHPTEELTEKYFKQLLVELEYEPMNRTNNALEALMYFGPQAKAMIEEHGFGSLNRERAEFLWGELAVAHAQISIRVVDKSGEVRTWIEPTKIPFDRRHVFQMKTKNLQPLVMSGTVKRVGLDHIWTRL